MATRPGMTPGPLQASVQSAGSRLGGEEFSEPVALEMADRCWNTAAHFRTAEQLRNQLQHSASHPVRLVLTRNRVALVSVKFLPLGVASARLSERFLDAPDDVILALGHYLRDRDRSCWRVVRDFVASLTPLPALPRRLSVVTQGRVYDLAIIRDRINRIYFEGALDCRITWSRHGTAARQARSRSLRYGSFNRSLNLVRINPLLDDRRVPPEFLDYIVFHEMLHAAVPSERRSSRWRHHHGRFAIQESRYPEVDRMQRLARELIPVLLARGKQT